MFTVDLHEMKRVHALSIDFMRQIGKIMARPCFQDVYTSQIPVFVCELTYTQGVKIFDNKEKWNLSLF